MRTIGFIAVGLAISGGIANYKGWVNVKIDLTPKGRNEARSAANSTLDAIRKAINDGLAVAQEQVDTNEQFN